MEFLVKDRSIVTPGMAIAKGPFRYEYGVDKFEDTILSSVLGIVYIENDGIRVVPLEGKSSNPVMFSRVDFPQPDGPIIDRNSPFSTSRFTFSRATVSISSVR